MYNLNEHIAGCFEQYEREIRRMRKFLKNCPEGYLIRRTINGSPRYFQVKDGREKGITKNPALVKALTQKKYAKEYLKRLEINYVQLKKLHLKEMSMEAIRQGFSKAFHSEDLTALIIDEDEWQYQEYETNQMHPEQKIISTSKGIWVRSKSEQIIGNALEAHGIPYRYEEKLQLSGYTMYPDFTINFQGEIKYWEHWGLIDNPNYVSHMNRKLKIYEENDIIPWKNLICTYESDTRDMRRIDRLIELIFN